MSFYDNMLKTFAEFVADTCKNTARCVVAIGNGIIQSVGCVGRLFIKMANAVKETIKEDCRHRKAIKEEAERQNREWLSNFLQRLDTNLRNVPLETGPIFSEEISVGELGSMLQVLKEEYEFEKKNGLSQFMGEQYGLLMEELHSVRVERLENPADVDALKGKIKQVQELKVTAQDETNALVCAILNKSYEPGMRMGAEETMQALMLGIEKLQEFESFHQCKHDLFSTQQVSVAVESIRNEVLPSESERGRVKE